MVHQSLVCLFVYKTIEQKRVEALKSAHTKDTDTGAAITAAAAGAAAAAAGAAAGAAAAAAGSAGGQVQAAAAAAGSAGAAAAGAAAGSTTATAAAGASAACLFLLAAGAAAAAGAAGAAAGAAAEVSKSVRCYTRIEDMSFMTGFHSYICHLLQQEDRCKERLLLQLELQVLLLELLLGQQQDLEGMEERQQRRRGAGGS